MKKVRVWGIFYRIRCSSTDKWSKNWTGPMGVFALTSPIDKDLKDYLSGRAFFFRTRKQARTEAKKQDEHSNRTWTWVQHMVRPIKLTYEVIQN